MTAHPVLFRIIQATRVVLLNSIKKDEMCFTYLFVGDEHALLDLGLHHRDILWLCWKILGDSRGDENKRNWQPHLESDMKQQQ